MKSTENENLTMQISEFVRIDLAPALRNWRIYWSLSAREIKAAYRRSYLGMFWIAGSMTITVLALSVIYTFLFPTSLEEYLPFIAVSYVTWNLIGLSLTSSCNVMIKNAGYITQRAMPLTYFVMSNSITNLFIFANHFLIVIIVSLIFIDDFNFSILTIPVGLLIIFWTSIVISYTLASLTCRFRDIAQIINSLTQLAFFVTPVLWKPEYLSGRYFIAFWNPFYHYLELIRSPLIDQKVAVNSYLITISITIFLSCVGLLVISRTKRNIPYWV